jgi:hypothetical protein
MISIKNKYVNSVYYIEWNDDKQEFWLYIHRDSLLRFSQHITTKSLEAENKIIARKFKFLGDINFNPFSKGNGKIGFNNAGYFLKQEGDFYVYSFPIPEYKGQKDYMKAIESISVSLERFLHLIWSLGGPIGLKGEEIQTSAKFHQICLISLSNEESWNIHVEISHEFNSYFRNLNKNANLHSVSKAIIKFMVHTGVLESTKLPPDYIHAGVYRKPLIAIDYNLRRLKSLSLIPEDVWDSKSDVGFDMVSKYTTNPIDQLTLLVGFSKIWQSARYWVNYKI